MKRFARFCSLAIVACLLVGLLLSTTVFAENEKVQAASYGVLQVNIVIRDKDNKEHTFAMGSGFLVNSNTVITCHHCLAVTDYDLEYLAEALAMTPGEIRDRVSYSVTVTRDVMISATVINKSEAMDFAILQLSQSLQTRTPLTIRDEDEVRQTESVYAVGFPSLSEALQDRSTHTPEDATITNGQVSKVDSGINLYSGANTDYIQTTCPLSGGNSGGPMVDENGYVIGICQSYIAGYDAGEYFLAITIDQVTSVLKDLGITYTSASAPAADPEPASEPSTDAPVEIVVDTAALDEAIKTAQELNLSDYSEESAAAVESKLAAAQNAMLSKDQSQINQAARELNDAVAGLEKGKSNLFLLLVILAIVAVLVIIGVVLLVVLKGKKKSTAPAAPQMPIQQQKAPAPVGGGFVPGPMSAPRPGTIPLNPEAGATTVLTQGAGETTVLSQKVNGGCLIRTKTGERIDVNSAEFTIGRERKRVNYCISDNTSVSRVHAKVVVRNGCSFLVDMNAANGTFVNGNKAAAGQEIPLKTGDKITLSDEDFEFKA